MTERGVDFDAIRAANPIETIIGQAVDLKKAGREYKGCCPFHDERTPSFHVIPDKGFYHCFGCGAHGDVIDFVAAFQRIEPMEAIAMLTNGDTLSQSDEDKAQRAIILREREKEQAERQARAIAKANALWEKARHADPHHPYLVRKGVEAHTCKQLESGELILPVRSADGDIQSVQTINDAGEKKFLAGAPMAGGRMMIGINMGRTILCEGYATGASIYDALPDQVCVTFSCGNMEKVARAMVADGKQIILAADTGMAAQKMQRLAQELGVPVVIPTVESDFNDQAKALGIESVALSFRDALRAFAENKAKRDTVQEEVGPVDLWAAPPVPRLPRGILPPLIERFAFDSADQMGTDPAGFAMSALAVCASVIDDKIKLKPKQHENWTENARIWTMLVGAPSTRKSPMISKATARIKKMDADLLRKNNRALAEWQEAGGPKSGDPKPLSPRLRVEDATTEAVQEVAKESPRGLLLLQDELSGFFGRIEKYGGKGGGADRSFWLQAYNGGQYAVNRVGRGSYLIDNLSITLLGGIQPDKVMQVVKAEVDDGLTQRFIPIVLQKAQRDRDIEMPDVAGEFGDMVEALHDMKPPSNFFGAQPFTFSEGAMAIREQLADKHFSLVCAFEGVNTKLSSHFGKYDGLFPRLCLLWHCIEHAGKDAPAEISEGTARRVASFLHDFIIKHSFCFYIGLAGLADNQELVRALGGYVLAHQVENITMASAIRNVRQMRNAPDWERERAMGALEAFGWIEPEQARSAKPSWNVMPGVHTKFAEIAEAERIQRNEVRAIILEEAEVRRTEKGQE